MTLGLVGKKCGMTRVFTPEGEAIPVTVIEVLANKVTQLKTADNDGYTSVQISTGKVKQNRVSSALAGHYAKANIEPGYLLKEFAVDAATLASLQVGAELKVDLFKEGQFVDVTGVTKGKGYAGAVKRHHFRTQDATHGNSVSHRAPGSIGQRQSPGKVFKGKKMSGHLGDVQRTIQSQKIVKIDTDKNLILVKGAVPGGSNGFVVIRPAVKKSA